MTPAQDLVTSDLPGAGDLPLGTAGGISDAEYARLMRRIGIAGGETGSPVSAFSSSI